MKNNAINVKTIGAVILLLLIGVMFFSKTIYTYSLPLVTGVSPSNGRINKSETTTGLVEWQDTEELYSEISGKVTSILVDEGDTVEKGQLLYTQSFETDDIMTKLEELSISRKKMQLDIESINTKLEKTYANIAELEAEEYKKEAVSDYEVTKSQDKITKSEEDLTKLWADYQVLLDEYAAIDLSIDSDFDLEKQADKIAKAEEELNKQKILHNVGAVTSADIESAEYELANMRKEYENLKTSKSESKNNELVNKQKEITNKEKEIKNSEYELSNLRKDFENLLTTRAESDAKADEAIIEKEKERQKKLKEYQYEIESYNRELAAKSLESANQDITERNYNKTLTEYENNANIYSPADGIVTSINLTVGQNVGNNQLVMSFGIGINYKIICNVSLENNFITVGDTCRVRNSSHSVTGTVTKITPTDKVKELTVYIESDEISVGETFELTFEKQSSNSYSLVPNSAVNMDNDGYFLYQIKKRKGILGDEYYVDKVTVYIGDSDSSNTIITKGIGFFEPIVLLSDKPFSDNQTVRVKNEGDFFAK